MNCSNSTSTFLDNVTRNYVRLLFSVLIFLLIIVSNVVLLVLQMGKSTSSERWTPLGYMIKVFAVVALVLGISNNVLYVLRIITDNWSLGVVACQSYGVFSSVLSTAWIDLLVVAAFERYLKLLHSDEHASYFSQVNTKILVYGTFVLLIVLHLGPVYGWGEYSFYRGELRVVVVMKNATNHLTLEPMSDVELSITASNYFSDLHHQIWFADHPLLDIFKKSRSLHMRNPIVQSAQGMEFRLRMSNTNSLENLIEDYDSGCLSEQVDAALQNDTTFTLLLSGADQAVFGVKFIEENALQYIKNIIKYQEATTCALDYTPVNYNIYSFVCFSWFTTLLLPIGLAFYIYISIYRKDIHNMCVISNSDGDMSQDILLTHVLAISLFISVSCSLPNYWINLLGGLGYAIPYVVHVTGLLLSYAMPASLASVYILTYTRNPSEALQKCCCYTPAEREFQWTLSGTTPSNRQNNPAYDKGSDVFRTLLPPSSVSICYTRGTTSKSHDPASPTISGEPGEADDAGDEEASTSRGRNIETVL